VRAVSIAILRVLASALNMSASDRVHRLMGEAGQVQGRRLERARKEPGKRRKRLKEPGKRPQSAGKVLKYGVPHRDHKRSGRPEHRRRRVRIGQVQLALYKIG
jgi:hypothetical protein